MFHNNFIIHIKTYRKTYCRSYSRLTVYIAYQSLEVILYIFANSQKYFLSRKDGEKRY